MPPPSLFALAVSLGALGVSLWNRRRTEARLEALQHEAIAAAYDRAARHALVGVGVGLAVFLLMGRGRTAMLTAVTVLVANALVVFLRRRAAGGDAVLARLAVVDLLATACLFTGAAAFLLLGGLPSLGWR